MIFDNEASPSNHSDFQQYWNRLVVIFQVVQRMYGEQWWLDSDEIFFISSNFFPLLPLGIMLACKNSNVSSHLLFVLNFIFIISIAIYFVLIFFNFIFQHWIFFSFYIKQDPYSFDLYLFFFLIILSIFFNFIFHHLISFYFYIKVDLGSFYFFLFFIFFY